MIKVATGTDSIIINKSVQFGASQVLAGISSQISKNLYYNLLAKHYLNAGCYVFVIDKSPFGKIFKYSITQYLNKNLVRIKDELENLRISEPFYIICEENEKRNFDLMLDVLNKLHDRTPLISFVQGMIIMRNSMARLVDRKVQQFPILRYLNLLLAIVSNEVELAKRMIGDLKYILKLHPNSELKEKIDLVKDLMEAELNEGNNYIEYIGCSSPFVSKNIQDQLNILQILFHSNRRDLRTFRLNSYVSYVPSYLYSNIEQVFGDLSFSSDSILVIYAHAGVPENTIRCYFKYEKIDFVDIKRILAPASLYNKLSRDKSKKKLIIFLNCNYSERVRDIADEMNVDIIIFSFTTHNINIDSFLFGFFIALGKGYSRRQSYDFAILFNTVFDSSDFEWITNIR